MQDKISLKHLLLLLLRECGEERILLALSQAKAQINETRQTPQTKPAVKAKPTIFELISLTSATDQQKTLLLAIGEQFERKTFLPTAHDARNFLEDYGVSVGNIRQRQDAVRPTVKVLSALSELELEKIAKGSAYRGPSQLGPLSDAIKAAGASLRKEKEFDTTKPVKEEGIQTAEKQKNKNESAPASVESKGSTDT